MYAGMEIGLYEAGLVTVFSMGIVFAALYVISLILQGFKMMAKTPAPAPAAKAAPAAPAAPTEDENIQAAIMAAVFEYERRKRVNPIARNMK